MNQDETGNEQDTARSVWGETGFSGITLVLGAGGGRLVELLSEQVRRADGQLAVLDYHWSRLRAVSGSAGDGAQCLRARYRHLPVLSDSVDLLVINGVLRETPETRYERLFEELWRALAQGGRLRISDILEPAEVSTDDAWRERNRLVRRLSQLLDKPAALSVNLTGAAKALLRVGYEDLSVSLLPGCPLTDAWLEDTVNALRGMAGRLVDRNQRDEIIERAVPRLIAAYAAGNQRAPERFVLSGRKIGGLALDVEPVFPEAEMEPDE